MDLSKIISISGMPGLYKVVGSMKNGAVVESLTDGKRFPTYASHKISSLADISIYTANAENVPLAEALKKIYEKEGGKETPELKPDSEDLKKYFESILPDYDKEKVHNSDMKKMISWYNALLKADLLKPEEENKEEDKTETAEVAAAEGIPGIPKVEKTQVKKVDTHQPQAPKPIVAAPRKNINVRRKTG